MRPSSGVSYTSRSWKGVCRRSTSVPSNQTPLASFRRSKIFSGIRDGVPIVAARRGGAGARREAYFTAARRFFLTGRSRPRQTRSTRTSSGRRLRRDHLVELLGLAAVVAGDVADVHIERGAVPLRPGVDREVRFREDDRAGGAADLRRVESLELVEVVPEDPEPHGLARCHAGFAKHGGRGQHFAVPAAVQVGDDVQSLHSVTPLFLADVPATGRHSRSTSGARRARKRGGARLTRAADETPFAAL